MLFRSPVPDPGLNGHLASGPFGFLIEYPCYRQYSKRGISGVGTNPYPLAPCYCPPRRNVNADISCMVLKGKI